MEYEDRLRIATPEGVDLTVTLAGVGSRFTAALIDLAIEIVLIVAVGILAGVVGSGLGSGYGAALVALLSFVIVLGYDVFFEVLHGGRTPGKQMNGLRVVRAGGDPITFVPSLVRNVLRIIDFLPTMYLTGIVTILATHRNQRVGDLVADTIVVRDRRGRVKSKPDPWQGSASSTPRSAGFPLDVSAITPEETAAVQQYLARRYDIDPDARRRLAETFVTRLTPKLAGLPSGLSGERLLEAIVAVKTGTDGPSRGPGPTG
jgi:uncharacterized RDD family membrane protein YckC